MSLQLVVYGPEGEQHSLYTTQRWPYGTQLVLQDGRKFRFAGAPTLLVVGNVLQAAANVANDVGRTGIAAAIGSKAPTLTLGGEAAANLYAEGYWQNSVTPGGGESYKIDNHLLGTTAVVFNLQSGLKTAITTTTRVDLIGNPYKAVIQTPVTTHTGSVVGVAASPIAASGFGWIQTAGMGSVLTDASVVTVLGKAVCASVVTAGTCAHYIPTEAAPPTGLDRPIIGICQRTAAVNAWADVLLTLES